MKTSTLFIIFDLEFGTELLIEVIETLNGIQIMNMILVNQLSDHEKIIGEKKILIGSLYIKISQKPLLLYEENMKKP